VWLNSVWDSHKTLDVSKYIWGKWQNKNYYILKMMQKNIT
jgi:hypothetical protein